MAGERLGECRAGRVLTPAHLLRGREGEGGPGSSRAGTEA